MFFRIFYPSNYIRLVSITLIFLLTIPLAATDDLFREPLLEQFNQLEENTPGAKKALIEGYCLLEALVKEINAQYGYSLTLMNASRLVKTNLTQFHLPQEVQESLLALINFIELVDAQVNETLKHFDAPTTPCIQPVLPLVRNWFGSDKQSSTNKLGTAALVINLPIPEQPEGDPPAGIVIGAVEIFAGALLCIIPHPVTWGIGGSLISDGLSRMLNDLPLNARADTGDTSADTDTT